MQFEDVAGNVDVVLDTIGGDTQRRSWKTLRKGGTLVATLGVSSPDVAEKYGARVEGISVRSDAAQLADIAKMIDAGELKPFISEILPLGEAARAHELSQSGHVSGKIVLKVTSS